MQHREVDNYKLLHEIGHGGMAVVYRARDTKLDRDVAIKILHKHIAGQDENRIRFEREARAVAKLKHRNIITIYGFSSPTAQVAYIVSELIKGPTLRTFIDENDGFYHPEVAAMMVIGLADALEHAHQMGVIHRDVKPENIMIDDFGTPKLMDFGLARLLDSQKVTITGSLMGSPAHMSAEMIEGKKTDHRVDIFALGTVLYFLTTKQLPFNGANPAVVLNAILVGKYLPPAMVNPRISNRLAKIIAKAMARNPEDRFQTAAEFKIALQEYLKDLEITHSDKELPRYFAGPKKYDVSLAQKLISLFETKALHQASLRHIAITLHYCDRILCLNPENELALKLIESMKKRRKNQEIFAISGIVLLLMIAISLIFSQKEPSSNFSEQISEISENSFRSHFLIFIPQSSESLKIVAEAKHLVYQAQIGAISQMQREVQRNALISEGLQQALQTRTHAQRIADVAANTRRLHALRTSRQREISIPHYERETFTLQNDIQNLEVNLPDPVQLEMHTIIISVNPFNVEISIDHQRVDRNSARQGLELSDGEHTIRIRHTSTSRALEQTFLVNEDTRFHFVLPWPPAELRVTADRPGRVFVDGEPVGRTGDQIEVEMRGDRRTRNVELTVYPEETSGDLFRQQLTLESASSTVIGAIF